MSAFNIFRLCVVLSGLMLWAGTGHAGKAAAQPVEEEGLYEASDAFRAVLVQAYQNNPALQAARIEWQVVSEKLPQAQAGWQPQITANSAITAADIEGSNYGSAQGSTSKMIGLSFSQPLFRGLRTLAATRGARDTIEAQSYLLRDATQNLLLDVATAYMDVVRDRAILELRIRNETLIREQRDATRVRFDVGDLTRTDLAQAEARLAQAQAERLRAAGNLQGTSARYEQLTGITANETLSYPDLSDWKIPLTREDAAVRAEMNQPLVLAAQAVHRAAEKSVDEASGALLPEVSLSADWDRTFDPQPGLIDKTTNKTVGIAASVPLYSAGNLRSHVRQARYSANQRDIEVRDTKRKAREQAITAWENLNAVQAEIKARMAQVEAAELARTGVYAEEEVGARTVLDTLDADREFLEAQVDLTTAQRDEIVALCVLWAATGDMADKILGMDVDRAEKQP